MEGKIFDIQRFSTNDGPGIRTVIFLKGCPLSCVWCHNPESKSVDSEIFYSPQKCIHCRMCERTCKHKQHVFESDKHIFMRENCEKCMKCVSECRVRALEGCGKDINAEDVISEALRDKEFYEQSGGGITLSGGEPLLQYDFSVEILKKAKEAGLHTAIETSGYSHKDLSEINRHVDLWLYDVKLLSESEHIKYTGVSNKIILENLYFLKSEGAKIILRAPIIPNVNLNKEHFQGIAALANELGNISAIHFEPYHPLGIDKAFRIGKKQEYDNKEFLSANNITPFVDSIRSITNTDIEIL